MAPTRPRAARLAPAERRAQLLACALHVFARRGLGRATHADVAAGSNLFTWAQSFTRRFLEGA